MSNDYRQDHQRDRMFKLATKVHMLVLDGKRMAQQVADAYQSILDQRDKLFFVTKTGIAVYDHGDHFTFTLLATDGITGTQWIPRFESKGFPINNYANSVLRSPDFKPTTGIITEVAVLKGMLLAEKVRITKNIRNIANDRKWITPNPEIACLIREMFTNEEIIAMGLTGIIAMHEPIKDSDGDSSLLCVSCDDGRQWLGAYYNGLRKWDHGFGFAFAVSHVSTQN